MQHDSSLAVKLMAEHGVTDSVSEEPSPSQDVYVETAVSDPAPSSIKANGGRNFDIESLDSFPTLGGSSPVANAVSTPSWGTVSNGAQKQTDRIAGVARSGLVSETFTLAANEQNQHARTLLSEVVSKARKTTNTVIDSSTSGVTGNTTFIIKGSLENIARAKRELLKELAIKTVKKLYVPASVRSAIIGSKGSTLRPIIEKSGTNIDVGKKEIPGDLDGIDEDNIEIAIEGFELGIAIAEKEILEIVNSRVKEITSRLTNIDAKLYPFIAQQAQEWTEGKDVSIKVPAVTAGTGSSPRASPAPTDVSSTTPGPIVITGERSAVLEARAQIEAFAAETSRTYKSVFESVPAAKFRFVSTDHIFSTSGVSALPSSDGTVFQLFGPSSRISHARDVLSKHVASLSVLSLDISRAHDKTVRHARALLRYFTHFGQFSALERTTGTKISTPPLQPLYDDAAQGVILEIVGADKDKIMEAKKAVVLLVTEFPPSRVLVVEDLDPFFHSHVQKLVKQIKQESKVDTVLAADETDLKKKSVSPGKPEVPQQARNEIIFVYTGGNDVSEDDFAPGDAEIQQTLKEVSAKFDYIREKQQDIASKALTIPHEHHKFIQGPNGTTLNAIVKGRSESAPFVSIALGVDADGRTKSKDGVYVRGLKSEVDRVVKEIHEVIEESKNYETLSSYTTEFTFPKEHINKLIGKQGTNLSKICDEFGVKVDVEETGQGIVKGIKKNADEAKARILAMGRRLADEVTLKLPVPNEHHATLIGQGGKFVKRLMDKYEVYIQFPRPTASGAADDSGNGLTKDQVLIRGPSKGVAKTKEEFLDLVKYEVDHSHMETIMVPRKALPRIIGRQGEFINAIKESSNTRIDVRDENERNSPEANGSSKDKDGQVPIEIVGTKTGVKSAVDSIQDIVNDVLDFVEEEISVPSKYHGAIIGPQGATRRDIVAKAGGDTVALNAPSLHIPPAESKNPVIKVTGSRKVVSKIIKQIQDIVSARENQVTERVKVLPEQHGGLIGPAGIVKREIETEFDVTLQIPKKGGKKADGSLDDEIVISGPSQEGIDKAKARIAEITQDSFKTEVLVPRKIHAELSNKGAFIRKLQVDYGVRVDHGPKSGNLPKAVAIPAPPKEAFGSDATDDEGVLKYKFSVVPDEESAQESENGKSDTVLWRLRGDSAACNVAKESVEKAVKDLLLHDSTGYLWFADSSKYGSIIGPQGSRINRIRTESGCTIVVPRAGSQDSVVTLRGNAQQLESAKKLIIDVVSR